MRRAVPAVSLDDDIASHERELNRLRKVKTMAAEICRALAAVPDAETDADPATRGPIGAAPSPILHPDGCHTTDAMATRDCTSDGHHECVNCTRFDAAGRSAMGDDPIGGHARPAAEGRVR